jgi:signal transduction histidine kinase
MNVTTPVDDPEGSLPEMASLVHDLRNPLSTIRGGAEIHIGSRPSELQLRRIARNLYFASLHMNELFEEFLSQYREAAHGVEICDLARLAAGAVDRIAPLAESQAVEIVRYIPENLAIALDRRRIERVLVNLLVNALDAMPNGGMILISAVVDRRSALIKVCDTGPGVAPEIRDRLSRPFVTSGKANGVGLGLALSRQAILDHGGQMWAETDWDGACFAFRLPLSLQNAG